MLNLAPGPAMSDPMALAAMTIPIQTAGDPDFTQLYRNTVELLGEAYCTSSRPAIMHGECLLGLEAAAYAAIRPTDVVLNIEYGSYGKGYSAWAERYASEVVTLRVPYDRAPRPEEVKAALDADARITTVAFVHCETMFGTAGPLEEIAAVVEDRDCLLIVDAASTFAGMPIKADEWNLDLVVGAPHKCLGGPVGLSLIHVSERARDRIHRNPSAPRGTFVSLADWIDVDPPTSPFPCTPSVSNIGALNVSLRRLLAGGLTKVWERHDRVAKRLRAGVAALGLSTWADKDEDCASTVTAIRLPSGVSAADIVQAARAEWGVNLLTGRGDAADQVVVVGHMGSSAHGLEPILALTVLGSCMNRLGATVSVGEAVEAALAVEVLDSQE